MDLPVDLKRIRDERKRDKLSQRELAEAIGVAPSQISRFETGKRRLRLDEAQKIADKLNIPLPAITGNGESESPVPPARKDMRHNTIMLPEGRAIVEYPASLSLESRGALKEWLELIARLTVRQ